MVEGAKDLFGKEKNKGGAPPMYKSPEELQQAISDYFDHGYTIKKVVVGKEPNVKVVEIPVVSISGLVLFCGFESRQSFYDYEKREQFSYTIKRTRTFIEKEYEEAAQSGNPAGPIFLLKNFGWSDQQESKVSGDMTFTIKYDGNNIPGSANPQSSDG